MDFREKLDAAERALEILEGLFDDLSGENDLIDLRGAVEAAMDEAKSTVKTLTPYAEKEWDEEEAAMEREYWSMVI